MIPRTARPPGLFIHVRAEQQPARRVNALLAAMADARWAQWCRRQVRGRPRLCCVDGSRGCGEGGSFTFLGYTFCPRSVRSRHGVMFTAFVPAISKQALKDISRQVRRWRIHTRTRHDLSDLADLINPIVRGWMQYYGRFYGSMLLPLLRRINGYLVRWARKKYRRLVPFKRVKKWWDLLVERHRGIFTHWQWATGFLWIR